MVDKPTAQRERELKIIEEMKRQICELLDEERNELFRSYRECLDDGSDKFSVGMAVKLIPRGPVTKIESKIGWSRKIEFSTVGNVSHEPEIPGLTA